LYIAKATHEQVRAQQEEEYEADHNAVQSTPFTDHVKRRTRICKNYSDSEYTFTPPNALH
jgi:hypothetical protein